MVLLKSLATPLIWVLAACAAGLVLTRYGRKKRFSQIGWSVMLAGVLLLWGLSLRPVANLLVYSLECQYGPPLPHALGTPDVIVVLGGGMRPSGGLRAEAELSERAFCRLYHGVKVLRQTDASLLALCGGEPSRNAESEAQVMETVAIYMGVPPGKILTETRSHDTNENAVFLAELLTAGEKRRIGLVTSATHMPRALKVFTRQFPEDSIIPIPTHFTYSPPVWTVGYLVPAVEALENSTAALHEWIGILWYSLRYW